MGEEKELWVLGWSKVWSSGPCCVIKGDSGAHPSELDNREPQASCSPREVSFHLSGQVVLVLFILWAL